MAGGRIYVDTSVLGGCFDAEFSAWSNGLVEDFRRGVFRAVLSDVIAEEIGRAPATVQAIHQELLNLGAEVVSISSDVLHLVAAYEARAILGPRFRNDLLHIALATVASVDVLVSWNFRHIVRLDRIQLFNEVNAAQGRAILTIYSPREVTTYERNETDSDG
jgi:predicted nucleic acid-binding protein